MISSQRICSSLWVLGLRKKRSKGKEVAVGRPGAASLDLKEMSCRRLRGRPRSRQPLWSPPDIGGRRNRCRHRRGIPQDVPATESDDHHPKQKCDYDHDNRRDGHSPSTADLDLTDHLVHRRVFIHDESKRCIDCADVTDRRAYGQAPADVARSVPSGSSALASAAVTPASLHLEFGAPADTLGRTECSCQALP
jgi:hypothetical protein